MSRDQIRTACVIRYPYLWARQAKRGETEGRKLRPVAVGVRLIRPVGDDLLVLFPITTKTPDASRFAVEVPETEKRRAGLDRDRRLWIVFDEYNQDHVDRSFYLEPEPPIGRFSKAFFLPLLQQFIACRGQAKRIDRRE